MADSKKLQLHESSSIEMDAKAVEKIVKTDAAEYEPSVPNFVLGVSWIISLASLGFVFAFAEDKTLASLSFFFYFLMPVGPFLTVTQGAHILANFSSYRKTWLLNKLTKQTAKYLQTTYGLTFIQSWKTKRLTELILQQEEYVLKGKMSDSRTGTTRTYFLQYDAQSHSVIVKNRVGNIVKPKLALKPVSLAVETDTPQLELGALVEQVNSTWKSGVERLIQKYETLQKLSLTAEESYAADRVIDDLKNVIPLLEDSPAADEPKKRNDNSELKKEIFVRLNKELDTITDQVEERRTTALQVQNTYIASRSLN